MSELYAIVGSQDVNVTGLYKTINASFDTSGNIAQGLSDNSLIIGAIIAIGIVVLVASGALARLFNFIKGVLGFGVGLSHHK